jgi:hypothetical protein
VFRRKTPKVEELPAKPVVSKAASSKPAKKPAKPIVKEQGKLQKKPAIAKKTTGSGVVLAPLQTTNVGDEMPSVNPTPSKRQVLERHRRRSSLSGLSMGRRRSSVGIGFTHGM